jgi:hypothetical protein
MAGTEAPALGESRRTRLFLTPVATAPLLDSTEAPTTKPDLLEISGVLTIRDLDVLSSTPSAPDRCGARPFQHLRLLATLLHE